MNVPASQLLLAVSARLFLVLFTLYGILTSQRRVEKPQPVLSPANIPSAKHPHALFVLR